MGILSLAIAAFFAVVGGAVRRGRPFARANSTLRGVALAWAAVLLALAAQTYLGRFERLFDDHTIFAGVTYTEAHVTLTGMLIVAGLLALGALAAMVSAFAGPRIRWLVAAPVPAATTPSPAPVSVPVRIASSGRKAPDLGGVRAR